MNKKKIVLSVVMAMMLVGCASNDGNTNKEPENTVTVTATAEPQQAEETDAPEKDAESAVVENTDDIKDNNELKEKETMDFEAIFKDVKLSKTYKGFMNNNPIIEQHYGADPFALVYDDTVYFYMTADAYEYDEKGEIKENSYSKIRSLYVVSTKDMINFTDHGEITIAGAGGATKWAHNSWAPAAAWKMVDGKPKFFLYFADNGGGIGVVCADSPVGPFRDELGHGLIRRDMENCGNVEWLFDPAVLVDDDGKAYIYFGGGVPRGEDGQPKAAHPYTARCAQLGDDMMSLVDVPVSIDAPYLFEDSGIHKYGDTY